MLYVLGRAALTLCLGKCSVGSSGTASPITQAGHSRCDICVGCVHPPLIIEPRLLLAGQWEGFTRGSQLQGRAVTRQPTSVLQGGTGVERWCSDMVCSYPLGAQALGFSGWCKAQGHPAYAIMQSEEAATCAGPRDSQGSQVVNIRWLLPVPGLCLTEASCCLFERILEVVKHEPRPAIHMEK